MSHIANKIVAVDKPLHSVFSETRYRIDSFQREYRWQHKQIEALISDLTSSFMSNYEVGHSLANVESYDCYYMGPIVLCEDKGEMSVVDGQQRLTSFSLLLIYLRHLQVKHKLEDVEYRELNNYLFVSKGGRKTFCLDVPSRVDTMRKLLTMPTETIDFEFSTKSVQDKESNENLIQCYDDISHIFPKEINKPEILPLFIEWLILKVVLVEIKAFSVDNAYTIFETMNDRGLSLNPTEILKAFVLSKITDDDRSEEMNDFWKSRISELKYTAGSDSDLSFFRAWFRAKYARNISQGKSSDEKLDYEQIGAQFHTWFKNNHKLFHLHNTDDFYYFVKADFDFYSDFFCKLIKLQKEEQTGIDEAFYVTSCYPMADSLCIPLFIAPVLAADSQDVIKQKSIIVNNFIDVYINRRILSGRSVNQSSIKRSIFEIIKKIRNVDVKELLATLIDEVKKYEVGEIIVPYNIGFAQNYLHYVLARVSYSLDENKSFNSLLRSRKQSSYILVQIFSEDEWEEYRFAGTENVASWSLYNYCLCRRDDVKNMPEPLNERIAWLIERNYLPELNDCTQIDQTNIIEHRIIRLNQIVNEKIWATSLDHIKDYFEYEKSNMLTYRSLKGALTS